MKTFRVFCHDERAQRSVVVDVLADSQETAVGQMYPSLSVLRTEEIAPGEPPPATGNYANYAAAQERQQQALH